VGKWFKVIERNKIKEIKNYRMEFFFLKQELRNRIVKRLENKIKINDWIAMVLAVSGTMLAVFAVRLRIK